MNSRKRKRITLERRLNTYLVYIEQAYAPWPRVYRCAVLAKDTMAALVKVEQNNPGFEAYYVEKV